MTINTSTPDVSMTEEAELIEAEIETKVRDSVVLASDHEHAAPDMYPRLFNLSAGMIYRAIIRAETPAPPEFVTVPVCTGGRDRDLQASLAVSRWNMLWEAAQFRRRLFSEEDLSAEMNAVADRGDFNIVFVPRTNTRYYEYAPLFHLLPRAAIDRYSLPLLRGGQWPFISALNSVDAYLPADFETRLSHAWASTIWRHLIPDLQ